MSEPRESDLRRHPRAPIELKVEYKKLNTFFADYTKNISKGGTFIKTRRPLAVGTEFVFKLLVPTMPEPIALRGKVKWVVTEQQAAADAQNPEAGMGIRFIYDDDDLRERIEAEVERLMVDSLGELLYSKLMGR